MNPLPRRTFLGLGLGFVAAGSNANAAPAAGAPPAADTKEELIKFKKVEIAAQKAPDFTLKGGTTDKRWKAKEWLEIDFEIDVKAPKAADRKLKFLDNVTIKYYVFMSPADQTKKKILVAEVTYLNVPIDETIHSVVYLSHSSIVNITGDKIVDKSQITFTGAEATYNGNLVGIYPKGAGASWWKAPTAPPVEEGRLLPKHKTPFAPLWYDYYMEEKTDK
jgi:hypothetical protein